MINQCNARNYIVFRLTAYGIALIGTALASVSSHADAHQAAKSMEKEGNHQ
jgi:hypothetical protein